MKWKNQWLAERETIWYQSPLNNYNYKNIFKFDMREIFILIVHSTKLLNFDWSRAVQLIPNCTP